MPYIGDRLAPLFSPDPAERAAKRLAEAGGDSMQEWVRRNTPVDMGTLRASWTRTPVMPTRHKGSKAYITHVQTEIDYAPHVEWGTGIYGPQGRPYTIRPRRPGGVLSWVDERTGDRVYARSVQHPGSPGQHMMAIGAAMAEHSFEDVAQPVLVRWKVEQEAAGRQ